MPNGPMKRLLEDIRQRVRDGAAFYLTPIGEIRELVTNCCPALVGSDGTNSDYNNEAEDILESEGGMSSGQASRFIHAADNYRVDEHPKTAALRRALLRACGLEGK